LLFRDLDVTLQGGRLLVSASWWPEIIQRRGCRGSPVPNPSCHLATYLFIYEHWGFYWWHTRFI